MEKLLDKNEVAEILGIKVKTLERWIQEKRIPFVRLSAKCVRFFPSDIKSFLEKRAVRTGYPSW